MVKEISYEDYKRFCSYLSSKDVFFYIKTLFVRFRGDSTVYAIKTPADKDISSLYYTLEKKHHLTYYTMEEFKSGLSVSDKVCVVKKNMYKDKNILVTL